ncbi:rhomboid family intramembrane serine protease [Mucilaginibacter terrigena]|uniref:Rhomboid family intramembrane serine protease n=1 Tax=Mucilaginibacter terrigena TaxID=2492395 RepID=A0A4Q5LHI9_9SPHI|nr:rhomboid family intramembrane serine protease [Mucilaginibacter terrigena]RYU86946.1 rhomboid family intramembrane serine protease [Mucilaginibacter terrigena]
MQSPFANMPPVVKNLLIINIIFFIATYALAQFVNLQALLSAYYFNSPFFKPWQIITYMFMHGGFGHIFFNMFALVSFGPMLEYTLGSKKFFNYYFLTGIGGYVLYTFIQAIEVHAITGGFTIANPQLVQSYEIYGQRAEDLKNIYGGALLGASGAVFGILVGFAMLFPNLEMMIMFIPVPIKAKYVVIGYVAIELFTGVGRFAGDNVAHFAHLGGALFGFLLIKLWGIKKPNNFY